MRVGSKGHLTEQGPHVADQMLFMNGDEPAEWVLGGAEGAEGYDLKHTAPNHAGVSSAPHSATHASERSRHRQ